MDIVREEYTPKQLSASGNVYAAKCSLIGFLCTTAGTLQVKDGGSGGTVIIKTFDVAEGGWYPMPFSFPNGAYAELTSAEGTFGYLPY